MIKKQNYHLRFLFLAFGLALVTLCCSALFFSSQRIKDVVIDELQSLINENGFTRGRVSLRDSHWGGISHPLSITIDDLIVTTDEATLTASKVITGISFFKLVMGRTEIKNLHINDMTISRAGEPIAKLSCNLLISGASYDVKIKEAYLNPSRLAGLLPAKESFLYGINFPFTVHGKMHFDGSKIRTADLSLSFEGGEFTLAPYYPTPTTLSGGELELSIKDDVLSIHNFSILRDKSRTYTTGQISLSTPLGDFIDKGGRAMIDIKASAENILLDDLPQLWPEPLAPKPRAWVTENITRGHSPLATLNLSAEVDVSPSLEIDNVKINELGGDISVAGAEVNYLGHLPKIQNAAGNCHYTSRQFIIDAVGNGNGINIDKGHIVIYDMDRVDQTIEIELDLSGPVEKALDLLSKDPLNFPQKLKINPKSIKGSANTHLILKFPLESYTSVDMVGVSARAKIVGAILTLDDSFFGNSTPVTQGHFDLNVDNDVLELSGNAHILGQLSDIYWKELFNPDPKGPRSDYTIKTSVNIPSENKDESFLHGSAPLETSYQINGSGHGQFSITADLTKLGFLLHYISFHKDDKTPAKFTLKGTSANNGSLTINEFDISSEKDKITGTGSIQGGKFNHFDLHVHVADLQGKLNLSGSIEAPIIKGTLDRFDVDSLLNDLDKIGDNDNTSTNFSLDLVIKSLNLGNKISLGHAKTFVNWKNGELHSLQVVSDAPHLFHLVVAPEKANQQDFSLECHQAGDVLDHFSPSNDLEGGVLKMVGSRTKVGQTSEIYAEVDLRDFSIVEAPVLAHLLSAASLDGIIHAFSGKGLHFDNGTGALKWKSGLIQIKHLFVSGTSLGISLKGDINTNEETISLQGELYPLNSINYLMAHIPLIGSALSGGSNKGVFSTSFALSGKRDDPTIKINPLSTIAPGGIRRVMKEATTPHPVIPGAPPAASPVEPTAESPGKESQKPHSP